MKLYKKQVSIYFMLMLRFVISIIYFIVYCTFNNFVYDIGRLDNIGLKNSLIVLIMIVILFIALFLTTMGTQSISDPYNHVNVNKYRMIFILQLITMISNSCLLKTYGLDSKTNIVSNLLIFVFGLIAVLIHSGIIKQYQMMDNKEKDKLIEEYKLPKDEKLIFKISFIRRKILSFFVLLVIIGSNIEWVLFNIYITIIVMCIWIFIINKLFSEALFDLYNYLEMPETSKKIMLKGYIMPSTGLIFMHMLYKEVVKIPIILGIGTDALAIIWILSLYPFMKSLMASNVFILRMEIKWLK